MFDACGRKYDEQMLSNYGKVLMELKAFLDKRRARENKMRD